MFYICIPGNIVSNSNIWNHGYVIVLVDGISVNIKIKSFSHIINCNNKKYFIYKINSSITSGINYKISTLRNESYLITNNNKYITHNNYNTFLIDNNIYDNGIATIYHDKSYIFIKIENTVVEVNLQN